MEETRSHSTRSTRAKFPRRLESSHDGTRRDNLHAQIAAMQRMSSSPLVPSPQTRPSQFNPRPEKKAASRKATDRRRRTPRSARPNAASPRSRRARQRTLLAYVAIPRGRIREKSRHRACRSSPQNVALRSANAHRITARETRSNISQHHARAVLRPSTSATDPPAHPPPAASRYSKRPSLQRHKKKSHAPHCNTSSKKLSASVAAPQK